MNSSFATFIKEFQAAPLTRTAYEESLERFDKFLGGRGPTERLVEDYMLSLENSGLSSATVNRHLAAIRAYFLWMKKHSPPERRGYWDLMVTGPKTHHKLPPLVPSENVMKMLSVAETPYERALVMLFYDSAIRLKELLGLEVSDIDYRIKQIKVLGKGDKERMIPIGDKTLQALREYIEGRQGKVFALHRRKVYEDVRRLGKRAGIKGFHPHLFRHARAENMTDQGVDTEDIQKVLGHENIQTTMIYARRNTEKLREKINPAFPGEVGKSMTPRETTKGPPGHTNQRTS